jgi:hypothetical protein
LLEARLLDWDFLEVTNLPQARKKVATRCNGVAIRVIHGMGAPSPRQIDADSH